MGIKVLNTPAAQVTATVPVAKDIQIKTFQISRTDTVSSTKLILPADATLLFIESPQSVASDSATSATATVTMSNNSGSVSVGADNVKTNGATTRFVPMTNLPNVEPLPLNGDLVITGVYAEVGASTVGGPWTYIVAFAR